MPGNRVSLTSKLPRPYGSFKKCLARRARIFQGVVGEARGSFKRCLVRCDLRCSPAAHPRSFLDRQFPAQQIGIIVDAVVEVMRIPMESIERCSGEPLCLLGTVRVEDMTIHVLDSEKALPRSEIGANAETVTAATNPRETGMREAG